MIKKTTGEIENIKDGNNSNEIVVTINGYDFTIKADTLTYVVGTVSVSMPSNILQRSTQFNFLGVSSIDKSSIQTITFKTDLTTPAEDVVDTYDVGIVPGEVTMWVDSGNNIIIGANGRIRANLDSSNLFYNFTAVTDIYGLTNMDTSGVNNMASMFFGLNYVTGLDLSSFNTSRVTNMSNMFGWVSSALQDLDLSSFDTSNVKDMNNMFYSMNALIHLHLTSFDTSNVTNMTSMFNWDSSLANLEFENADFSSVTSKTAMFSNVPTSCTIRVKDNNAKAFIQTVFSGTNIIIP